MQMLLCCKSQTIARCTGTPSQDTHCTSHHHVCIHGACFDDGVQVGKATLPWQLEENVTFSASPNASGVKGLALRATAANPLPQAFTAVAKRIKLEAILDMMPAGDEEALTSELVALGGTIAPSNSLRLLVAYAVDQAAREPNLAHRKNLLHRVFRSAAKRVRQAGDVAMSAVRSTARLVHPVALQRYYMWTITKGPKALKAGLAMGLKAAPPLLAGTVLPQYLLPPTPH